jgi:hypothetical protein
MGEKDHSNWRRTFNRYVGLGAAVVGIAIVLSSFRLLGNPTLWYVSVMVGLLIVLAGFIYGTYPFLTSERRYVALRDEVDRFIALVRRLNLAATRESEQEFQRVKSEMAKSVERMAELAGKAE